MEGIAVSASTGAMNSLLSKLSILLSDQYKQLKGVRKDIEFLSRELAHMSAALETLANLEKLEPQTKVWRDMVRETAYDIEDCIDIFMHNPEKSDDKDGFLDKIAGKIRKLQDHSKLTNKIQELKARVVEQSESRARYKIEELAASPVVNPVDPRVQAMFEDADRLVGIDGPRDEIAKLLLEEGDHSYGKPKVVSIDGFGGLGRTTLANQVYSKIKNEFQRMAFVSVSGSPSPRDKMNQLLMQEGDSDLGQLKVVSIVGFGGLGKTTLANQVYIKMKTEFQCAAFVSVSRSPDMSKILKDMLSGVGYGSNNMADDVDKLIMALTEHLADKRYLIVIDDIWSITDWNIIRCAFLQNKKASRVIVTTRIREVAAACCSEFQGHVYELQPLSNHDSRSLFFKRLFNTEDNCPENYREISEDMLRKCRGVPLAITSIASLLAIHGKDIEKWEKIRDSMGFELERNPTLEWMRHVLSLSYNDLPHHLKTCLLYLGTYPEDHEIEKDDLVRRWIGEGFVPKKHGLVLEQVAEGYFNVLINRNMIQPCRSWHGEVWSCRVHDLMLDLILLKCTEENFININDGLHIMQGTSKVHRISHQIHTGNMDLAMDRMSLSQVRSYVFHPGAKFVVDLSKFELLRVLYLGLGYFTGPDSMCLDLSGITHLFLLRYLKVRGFRLKLPKEIWKLQHLLTLDMECNLLDSSHPSLDVTYLSSLRHLILPFEPTGLELSNGVSKLYNLQTLYNFDVSMNSVQTIRDLGELTNLRELEMLASRHTSEEGSDTITLKYNTLAASLRMLGNSNLHRLSADIYAHEQFWGNCFTRPHHLQSLVCSKGIRTPQVPKWMEQADRLAFIFMLEVQQLLSDDVQVLAQMPCLTELALEAQTVPDKSIIIHSNAFPVLETFVFTYKFSCLTFKPGAMPWLKKLEINFYSRRPGAEHEVSPVGGMEHLASLEEVSVLVHTKRGEGSKLESLCRGSIQRHHRYQSLKISLRHQDYDD